MTCEQREGKGKEMLLPCQISLTRVNLSASCGGKGLN